MVNFFGLIQDAKSLMFNPHPVMLRGAYDVSLLNDFVDVLFLKTCDGVSMFFDPYMFEVCRYPFHV